jgi:hypothetical protein
VIALPFVGGDVARRAEPVKEVGDEIRGGAALGEAANESSLRVVPLFEEAKLRRGALGEDLAEAMQALGSSVNRRSACVPRRTRCGS